MPTISANSLWVIHVLPFLFPIQLIPHPILDVIIDDEVQRLFIFVDKLAELHQTLLDDTSDLQLFLV